MTPPTLDEQLALSLALIALRNPAAPSGVAPAPAPGGGADERGRVLQLVPRAAAESQIPPVLSPTSVNTYLDCSMRWYYRKVLDLPETRGAALGLGTAVHSALIENFRQKIETREDLPADGVRALFIGALTEQLDEMVLTPADNIDDLRDAGETMVRLYMDCAAYAVEPAAVEEHVEGFIGDVAVQGYIDVRTADGRIIDLKTAAKRPSGITPDHRLQLATYVMLSPHASGAATLSTMTKTKTVGLDHQSIDIDAADRRLTTRLYSIARDQMHAGIYAPRRNSFFCSRRFCSHWARCEDEFGGRVKE